MREELENIIKKYNLISNSFEYFWENYDQYISNEDTKDEAKENGFINRDSIAAKLYGYSYCISDDLDFDYIKVYIDCFRKGETMRSITYWCIYDLNGDLFDDYFVLE